MRNVFDQYQAPENRASHALLCAINEDRKLLGGFLREIAGVVPTGKRIRVLSQRLPGDEFQRTEDDAEKRGIPDGCITDDNGFALLVESKISARVVPDQLERHRKTAERHGIPNAKVLLITINELPISVPQFVVTCRWTHIYQFLERQRNSLWARKCWEYLEVLEAKEVQSGYLRVGTLTVFNGVRFDESQPYSYATAKRQLGLLRSELLKHKRLINELPIDAGHQGRGAIKGKRQLAVWDFIALRSAKAKRSFTSYPHLTLSLNNIEVQAHVTFPNGINVSDRRRLLGSHYDLFAELVSEVTETMVRELKGFKGGVPRIVVVQRRYASQSASPTMDCELRFDPRTAVKGRGSSRVKAQPEWLQACYGALRAKESNLQFQIGAVFPYATCPGTASPEIVDAIARTWIACRPALVRLNDGGSRRHAD